MIRDNTESKPDKNNKKKRNSKKPPDSEEGGDRGEQRKANRWMVKKTVYCLHSEDS